MNALMVQILAVGLTLGQLMTRPVNQFIPQFDLAKDGPEAERILSAGCKYLENEFQAKNLPIDAIEAFILEKPAAPGAPASNEPESMDSLAPAGSPAAPVKAAVDTMMAGFSLAKLKEKVDLPLAFSAYKQFCRDDKKVTPIKLDEAVALYNRAFAKIPDISILKNYKFKQTSTILDSGGSRSAEKYQFGNRRMVTPIDQIPESVQHAFVSAEDQNFYKHNGLDIRGIIRAFKTRFKDGKGGRDQGGSTITQQVIKNLVLNDDPKIERKLLEMLLAVKLEKLMKKPEILELYMNFVCLGRLSCGVDMASQSYFGKSVKEIDLAESAMLASLVRNPILYSPVLHADNLQARREYVLGRMKDDGYISPSAVAPALTEVPQLADFTRPHTRSTFFNDEVARDAHRVAGINSLTDSSYVVRSTVNPELRAATELALQDGLVNYEQKAKRVGKFEPEGSIAELVVDRNISWQQAMADLKPTHYDIRWPIATVLETGGGTTTVRTKSGARRTVSAGWKVGLQDGSTLTLTNGPGHNLNMYDLLFVKVSADGKSASLRTVPQVQGAIVVMEAKTGRVLALAGGFAYSMSEVNHVTQTARPCGSTLKPFIYLSALNLGYQPNTLISNAPLLLTRIDPQGQDWSPNNYDRGTGGYVTIRHAIEQSLNLPTARIMSLMGSTPTAGLDYIRGITQELGIYKKPVRYYPFVLGSQDTRLIDLAAAYATIANIGLKPTPTFIDSIEHSGKLVYERKRYNLAPVPSVDRMSFYQIRHILEGSVERGTAKKMKDLTGFVAGKTGTTNNNNDAWFVGFTNDLVVATWVGYDSRKIKSSLGNNMTGAEIALPIGEAVIRRSFDLYRPKEPLVGPPAEIASQVVNYPINPITGEFNQGSYIEAFRTDGRPGVPRDTTRSLLRGGEMSMGYSQDVIGDEEDPNYNEGPGHFRQQPYQDPYADEERRANERNYGNSQEYRRFRGSPLEKMFNNPFGQ